MADLKISELTNLTAADPVSDMLPIVDVSATPPASGSTKRISINNLLSSSPTASGALTVTGLVTAGSATITGALGAAGLNVTGATIPANGMYLGSANNLSFSAASTLGMTLNSTGNLAFPDAKGIDFSAKTPDGSGTVGSEVLNDYEEGTWTIGLTFGGGNTGLTTALNTGRYTKIGRQVTVCGRLELSNKGSSTGAAVITGLPFTIANANDAQQAASFRCNGVSYTGAFQGYGGANTTTIPLEQISEAGSPTDLTNSNFSNGTSIQISLTYTV
jgi:hypothetical protein